MASFSFRPLILITALSFAVLTISSFVIGRFIRPLTSMPELLSIDLTTSEANILLQPDVDKETLLYFNNPLGLLIRSPSYFKSRLTDVAITLRQEAFDELNQQWRKKLRKNLFVTADIYLVGECNCPIDVETNLYGKAYHKHLDPNMTVEQLWIPVETLPRSIHLRLKAVSKMKDNECWVNFKEIKFRIKV